MAQFPLKDFIDGTKQLATRLYGPNGQVISELNPMPVTLTGHIQEFAVLSWDDLDPGDVPVGSVAQLIGTDDIRQSNGSEWVVLT